MAGSGESVGGDGGIPAAMPALKRNKMGSVELKNWPNVSVSALLNSAGFFSGKGKMNAAVS